MIPYILAPVFFALFLFYVIRAGNCAFDNRYGDAAWYFFGSTVSGLFCAYFTTYIIAP